VILGGVIKASARNPLLTILLVAGLAVWGGCRCATHRSTRSRISRRAVDRLHRVDGSQPRPRRGTDHERTNIERQLPLQQPVEVAVTFPQAGTITYACGMDMMKGSIQVQ
jgi:hypothetical protein